MRIVDDVVQGALPGQLVRVLAGGALRARGAERSGGPGPLTVAFTPRGLQCAAGSECVFEGVYRQVGVAQPSPRETLASAGWLPAGEVVPCPGWDDDAGRWIPDCAGLLAGSGDPADLPGTSYEVGFVYPHGAAVSPPFVEESLAAMRAGDVLCFSDPDPATPSAPVDDGFCYEITLVAGDFAGAGILKIDVRQTNPARPRNTTYPFSLREVRQGSLLADAETGTRIAIVAPTVLEGTRAARAGRHVAPLRRPGRLAATGLLQDREDLGRAGRRASQPPTARAGRELRRARDLRSPRLRRIPSSAGDAIWVDYGHAPGETFFVMAPLVLTEADGLQEPKKDVSFVLQGRAALGAVLVDDTASLRLFGAQRAPLRGRLAARHGRGQRATARLSTSSTCPTHCFAG